MNRILPWIAALLISVLANGVMLGLVLNKVSDGPRFQPPQHDAGGQRARGDRFNYRAFLEVLPAAEREDARSRLESESPRLRELFQNMRIAQDNARDVLVMDPYDPLATQQAFDELRQARMAMESAMEAIILDIVADLDSDTRERAIHAGRRPPERRGRGPRDRRRPPPPHDRR